MGKEGKGIAGADGYVPGMAFSGTCRKNVYPKSRFRVHIGERGARRQCSTAGRVPGEGP